MVLHDAVEQIEPELGELGEHLALVGDLVFQNVVEGRDAVGGHEQQPVAQIVQIAHLALRVGSNVDSRHECPFSLMARLPLRSNTAQRTPFERRYPSAFRVSDIMAQIRPSHRRFTENGTIPLLFEMAKKYPLTVSRRTISGH